LEGLKVGGRERVRGFRRERQVRVRMADNQLYKK
jgi:hypothetical protein